MSVKIHRRAFHGFAAGAGVAALSGQTWAATSKFAMITPIQHLIGYAPSMNAEVGGHFRRYGLEGDIVGGANAPMAVQQTVVKRVDVMRGAGTDVATAVANQGAPLRAIGTIYQASSFIVISQASRPVRAARDFNGMTVGVPGRKSGSEQALDLLLLGAGLDLDIAKREFVGNSLGAWGLMRAGRIDAAVLSVSAAVQIQDAGEDPVLWPVEELYKAPGQVYAMHRDRLAAEPEFPVRFLRAIRDSMTELRASLANGSALDIVKRMAERYPIVGKDNPRFLVKAMTEEIKLWLSDGEENQLRNMPERWSSMVASMVKAGIIKPVDATSLYTNEYVDQLG